MLNFDADVKKTTSRHPCGNRFEAYLGAAESGTRGWRAGHTAADWAPESHSHAGPGPAVLTDGQITGRIDTRDGRGSVRLEWRPRWTERVVLGRGDV